MEKQMETIGIIGIILGLYRDYRALYWGYMVINGKENGNYSKWVT